AIYLGHTTGQHGCVGLGPLSDHPEHEPDVQRSLEGLYPVDVPIESSSDDRPEHLVFKLSATEAAVPRLEAGACLWLWALRVTFRDGSTATIDFGDHQPILGVSAGARRDHPGVTETPCG